MPLQVLKVNKTTAFLKTAPWDVDKMGLPDGGVPWIPFQRGGFLVSAKSQEKPQDWPWSKTKSGFEESRNCRHGRTTAFHTKAEGSLSHFPSWGTKHIACGSYATMHLRQLEVCDPAMRLRRQNTVSNAQIAACGVLGAPPYQTCWATCCAEF